REGVADGGLGRQLEGDVLVALGDGDALGDVGGGVVVVVAGLVGGDGAGAGVGEADLGAGGVHHAGGVAGEGDRVARCAAGGGQREGVADGGLGRQLEGDVLLGLG